MRTMEDKAQFSTFILYGFIQYWDLLHLGHAVQAWSLHRFRYFKSLVPLENSWGGMMFQVSLVMPQLSSHWVQYSCMIEPLHEDFTPWQLRRVLIEWVKVWMGGHIWTSGCLTKKVIGKRIHYPWVVQKFLALWKLPYAHVHMILCFGSFSLIAVCLAAISRKQPSMNSQ